MLTQIRGIQVILYDREKTGEDEFGAPIYEESQIAVDNVIVAPISASESLEDVNFNGKKAEYMLYIPKGDTHEWEDRTVEFFDRKWRTVGFAKEYIENMLPLDWNKQIKVVRYE